MQNFFLAMGVVFGVFAFVGCMAWREAHFNGEAFSRGNKAFLFAIACICAGSIFLVVTS